MVPEGWDITKLGEHVKIHSGHAPASLTLDTDGNVPYVKVDDMNNCSRVQLTSKANAIYDGKVVPINSVIFPKRGAAIMNNKVRITGTEMILDTNMMGLQTLKTLDAWFAYYRLLFEQLFKIADTSTIPQINNKHILPYRLSLPPLPEQRKIADILSTWDEAIEKTEALLTNARTQKRALMQQLLTGKRRFPEFEGQPWKEVRASEVFETVSKKRNENEPLLAVTQDQGVVRRDDLERRVVMPEGSTAGYKLVVPGNFIISLRSFQGGLEYSAVRGLVSPAYHVLRPKQDIHDAFYKHYFKSYDFIGHLAVAIIGIRDGKQISYNDFSFLKIPSPRPEEQLQIGDALDAAENEIVELQNQSKKFRTEKKALMQQLLTGKRRVKVEDEHGI